MILLGDEAAAEIRNPPRAQGRRVDLCDLVIALARTQGAAHAPYKIDRGTLAAARAFSLLIVRDEKTGDIEIHVAPL